LLIKKGTSRSYDGRKKEERILLKFDAAFIEQIIEQIAAKT